VVLPPPSLSRRPALKGLALAGLILALLAGWRLSGPALEGAVCREKQVEHPGPLWGRDRLGQTFVCPRAGLARLEVRLATFGRVWTAPYRFSLSQLEGLPAGPPVRFVPGGGAPLPLEPGREYLSLFTSPRGRLSGFKVLIYRRPGPSQGRVRLEVFRWGELAEPLRRAERAVAELPRFGFAPFEFEPLEDSAAAGLILRLSLTGARARGELELRSRPPAEDEELGLGQFPTPREHLWPGPAGPKWLFRPIYPPVLTAAAPLISRAGQGFLVSDNSFQAFDFPARPDSAGRAYYFELSAPQASPDTALTAWADPAGRGLVIDGLPTQGSLAFRAYCRAERPAVWALFLKRLVRERWCGFGRAGLVMAGLALQLLGGLALAGLALGLGRRAESGRDGDSD